MQVRELFCAGIVVGNGRYNVSVKALILLQEKKETKSEARLKASTLVYAHFQRFFNYLLITGLKKLSVRQKKCHDDKISIMFLHRETYRSLSCFCIIYREIMPIAIIIEDFLKPVIN